MQAHEDAVVLEEEKKKFQDRSNKAITTIVSRMDAKHYMSKRRYIIQTWREYVRRQKNFCRTIVKAIQTSILNRSMSILKNFSEELKVDDHHDAVLIKFRQLFYKKVLGNAFSNWRGGVR
jgi:predicted transcriptional regulator